MISYHCRIDDPKNLINIDKTVVYLYWTPKRTVHFIGSKKVDAMIRGASPSRFTLPVSVVMDGSKLP